MRMALGSNTVVNTVKPPFHKITSNEDFPELPDRLLLKIQLFSMTACKKKNWHHVNSFRSMLDGINLNELNDLSKMRDQVRNDDHDANAKEVV
jgi:hypothetical protein